MENIEHLLLDRDDPKRISAEAYAAAQRQVKGFNPDEPRDQRGRWTGHTGAYDTIRRSYGQLQPGDLFHHPTKRRQLAQVVSIEPTNKQRNRFKIAWRDEHGDTGTIRKENGTDFYVSRPVGGTPPPPAVPAASKVRASRVSAILRRGGLNPLGSGASRMREGLRVKQSMDRVYVAADLNHSGHAQRMAEAAAALLQEAGHTVDGWDDGRTSFFVR